MVYITFTHLGTLILKVFEYYHSLLNINVNDKEKVIFGSIKGRSITKIDTQCEMELSRDQSQPASKQSQLVLPTV